jgi:hypothetical protein
MRANIIDHGPLYSYIEVMESESTSPHYVPTSITLPAPLRDRLDAVALGRERSRSWIAARAIREYLDRQPLTDGVAE